MSNNIQTTLETSKITWDDIVAGAHHIKAWILNHVNNQRITLYGVPRGGSIPTVLIAYMLEKQGVEVRVAQALDHLTPNELRDLVVIDDISDSGETFKIIKQLYPMAKTAAVFCRRDSDFQPDCVVRLLSDNKWIEFPWENV